MGLYGQKIWPKEEGFQPKDLYFRNAAYLIVLFMDRDSLRRTRVGQTAGVAIHVCKPLQNCDLFVLGKGLGIPFERRLLLVEVNGPEAQEAVLPGRVEEAVLRPSVGLSDSDTFLLSPNGTPSSRDCSPRQVEQHVIEIRIGTKRTLPGGRRLSARSDQRDPAPGERRRGSRTVPRRSTTANHSQSGVTANVRELFRPQYSVLEEKQMSFEKWRPQRKLIKPYTVDATLQCHLEEANQSYQRVREIRELFQITREEYCERYLDKYEMLTTTGTLALPSKSTESQAARVLLRVLERPAG
jgi:hypothetical protein